MEKYKSYNNYKTAILDKLIVASGKTWENGVWKHTHTPLSHILPVEDGKTPIANRRNRAEAISKFLGFNCSKCLGEKLRGLHQYAHHLTSSQLLCMMFFSKLIDNNLHATEKLVMLMKDAFGIEIHKGAQCTFEYTEEKCPHYLFDVKDGVLKVGDGFYEGTSFDFHIKDGEIEVYFEIKFTENGFKKEKTDGRHELKAVKYLEIDTLPQFVKDNVKSKDDFLKQYQIYRNIIRATNDNKYVIFISDGNNPATNQDKEMMERLNLPKNIKFKTWQEIAKAYPSELPFQFKSMFDFK